MTYLVFLLIVAVSGTMAATLAEPQPGTDDISDAVDQFSMKFHLEAMKLAGKTSTVASPLGVQMLLALYAQGTGGALQQELSQVLRLDNSSRSSSKFADLGSRFSRMDPSYLTLSSQLFLPPGAQLSDNFAAAARDYHADTDTLDFSDVTKAADTINKWADEKSQHTIKQAVSASDLPPDTILALLNVIYFKGHWGVPFKSESTEDKEFHVDRSTVVNKPTMKMVDSFNYAASKDLGARLVELPYKEEGFRMIVVLPDELDGLPGVMAKLSQRGLLPAARSLQPLFTRQLDFEMPKFEVDSKLDLNQLLPAVGISKIFSDAANDIVKDVPVVVSKALQKAFVKVDEEGATAGAFTGIFIVPASANFEPPPPIEFHVDRPFFFAILHEQTVLFTGTYLQ